MLPNFCLQGSAWHQGPQLQELPEVVDRVFCCQRHVSLGACSGDGGSSLPDDCFLPLEQMQLH